MNKTLIAILLSLTLLIGFGPLVFKMLKADKYTYKVGETFCVENNAIPRFTAKIYSMFMLNEQELIVAGPDFDNVPPEFLSVIPVSAVDYWRENCK